MKTVAFGRCLIGSLLLLAAATTAAAVAAPQSTLSFTATPTSVGAGGQSALNWTATNVRRCSASGAWSGSRPLVGSANVGPLAATSTFTLRCWGRSESITRSVQVSVVATPAPTATLSAAPSSITTGGASMLNWSSTNATSCTAGGSWSGSKPTSGTQTTGPLAANATYSLSCVGAGGTANQSTTVVVAAPAPTVTLGASPTNIPSGSSSTLTWSSASVSTCTASGGWTGNKPTSGTAAVGPLTQDTTYSLSCSGANGSAVAMTSVAVRIARLSWTAPTRYSDGSALTPTGYRIYYGTTSKSYSQSVAINNASTTQLALPLPAGTWFFVVSALDAAGKESTYSNEARKTIN